MVDYEIIVIGAGPAGAMMTKLLAEQKFKVICIEKEIEVGYTNKSTAATPMDTFQTFELPRHLGFDDVIGGRVYGPNTSCELVLDQPVGRLLRFRETKQYLLQEAIKLGADTMLGTAVADAVMRDGKIAGVKYAGYEGRGTLTANVVVDASGPTSILGFKLGLWEKRPEQLGVAFEYFLENAKSNKNQGGFYLDFFIGNHIAPGGYGWIFPVNDHQVKAGICKLNPGFSPEGEKTQKEYFDQIWKKNDQIKDARAFEIHQCEHYISGGADRATLDNFMAIGDAISRLHPIFGEGCRPAFYSAKFATEALVAARQQNDYSQKSLSLYDKLWVKRWGKNWRFSTAAYRFLYNSTDDNLDTLIQFLPKIDPNILFRLYLGQASKMDYLAITRKAAGLISPKSLRLLFNMFHA